MNSISNNKKAQMNTNTKSNTKTINLDKKTKNSKNNNKTKLIGLSQKQKPQKFKSTDNKAKFLKNKHKNPPSGSDDYNVFDMARRVGEFLWDQGTNKDSASVKLQKKIHGVNKKITEKMKKWFGRTETVDKALESSLVTSERKENIPSFVDAVGRITDTHNQMDNYLAESKGAPVALHVQHAYGRSHYGLSTYEHDAGEGAKVQCAKLAVHGMLGQTVPATNGAHENLLDGVSPTIPYLHENTRQYTSVRMDHATLRYVPTANTGITGNVVLAFAGIDTRTPTSLDEATKLGQASVSQIWEYNRLEVAPQANETNQIIRCADSFSPTEDDLAEMLFQNWGKIIVYVDDVPGSYTEHAGNIMISASFTMMGRRPPAPAGNAPHLYSAYSLSPTAQHPLSTNPVVRSNSLGIKISADTVNDVLTLPIGIRGYYRCTMLTSGTSTSYATGASYFLTGGLTANGTAYLKTGTGTTQNNIDNNQVSTSSPGLFNTSIFSFYSDGSGGTIDFAYSSVNGTSPAYSIYIDAEFKNIIRESVRIVNVVLNNSPTLFALKHDAIGRRYLECYNPMLHSRLEQVYKVFERLDNTLETGSKINFRRLLYNFSAYIKQNPRLVAVDETKEEKESECLSTEMDWEEVTVTSLYDEMDLLDETMSFSRKFIIAMVNMCSRADYPNLQQYIGNVKPLYDSLVSYDKDQQNLRHIGNVMQRHDLL